MVESAKSICQLTAADVAAIAMIRNNAVWIQGLIKHCLRSWTAARTNFAISTLVFAKWQSHPPRENMSTTSRCDLFRDACKTTRSGEMNTDRMIIPRSKLRKYCHGQLRQLSRMSIRGFSCTIAQTKAKLDPRCQIFKMADVWEPCGR